MPRREIEGDWIWGWADRKRPHLMEGKDAQGRVILGRTTIWPTMRPPETMPDGINPGKSSDWIFDVDLIFPNFEVFPANGWYLTYNFWPLAVDQTYWDARLYIYPPQNAGERISQEFTRTFFHDTFREDLSTLELTQSMLRSGAATHLQLSDQEVLVRHGYKVVADYVGAL